MTRAQALEVLALTLLAGLASAAVPLSTGYFFWSWDALNHHVYLGLIAESPRWQLDVMPASYQTYQYPYLYWPVYRLSLMDGPGSHIGALWAGAQAALLLPPVWWICHRLLPDDGTRLQDRLQGVFERLCGCVLAFMSAIVLTALATTSNDVLAAVPLLWAVAVSLKTPASDRRIFFAAALWGMSVAFKLSNGLFLPLLVIWWWMPTRPHLPWSRGLALAAGASGGFLLSYGPWGWQLWQLTGNPTHPYLGFLFGKA